MKESSSERQRYPWEEDPREKKYPFQYFKYEVDKKDKIATVTLSDPMGRDSAPFWTDVKLQLIGSFRSNSS